MICPFFKKSLKRWVGTIQKFNPSDGNIESQLCDMLDDREEWGTMEDNTLKWESWFALSDNRSRILSVSLSRFPSRALYERVAYSPYPRVKERIVNHRMRPSVRNTGLSFRLQYIPSFFFYQKENLKQFVSVVCCFPRAYKFSSPFFFAYEFFIFSFLFSLNL